MSNVSDHDSAIRANTAAMKTTASILACPAEIIDSIIAPLGLEDVQSFRLSSRALQVQSLDHFRKTFFTNKVVNVLPNTMQNLVALADSEYFAGQVQALRVRFHEPAMSAACDINKQALTFTRRAFLDRVESSSTDLLLQLNVFDNPYFRNAICNRSPGDLIWALKEYKVGEVITVDMADRLNGWVEFTATDGWIDQLRGAIQNLPNLKSFSFQDHREHRVQSSAANNPQSWTHPSAALSWTNSSHALSSIFSSPHHITDVSLDFESHSMPDLRLLVKALQSLSPTLRKLSVAVEGYSEQTLRFDAGTQFTQLTELNIRDISPLSVLVGTLFQADSAGQFPALKVLRLENMRWVYQTFLDMITGVKVPTLVLTHIKHENLHINGRRTSPDDLITDIFRS
jgi:hypothetical protein